MWKSNRAVMNLDYLNVKWVGTQFSAQKNVNQVEQF